MSDRADPAEIEELAASGLFDDAWYLAEYPDVRAAGLGGLIHFYHYGWLEGRKPNQYFDTAWYLEQSSDVQQVGMNPLLHYLRYGDREGRRPSLHFDPAWYRAIHQLPDDTAALRHFLAARHTGQFAPCPELYAVPFIPRYRDDGAAGVDPYGHYLNDMVAAKRDALPDLAIIGDSGLVDPNYYLINGSDVHEAALDPAEHFCRHGWREGRKPNFYFDVRWYLETNPDIDRIKINPLMHYIVSGEAAGRRPVPYFDPLWYRKTYRIPAKRTALAHFLANRRKQAFSPTPLFDVAWYVAQHADELGTNRDPFAHYLEAGTHRDIDPSPSFNAAEYRKRHLGRPSRQFRQMMRPDRDNPLIHKLRTDYR